MKVRNYCLFHKMLQYHHNNVYPDKSREEGNPFLYLPSHRKPACQKAKPLKLQLFHHNSVLPQQGVTLLLTSKITMIWNTPSSLSTKQIFIEIVLQRKAFFPKKNNITCRINSVSDSLLHFSAFGLPVEQHHQAQDSRLQASKQPD